MKAVRMVVACGAVLVGGSSQAAVIDIDNGDLAALIASGVPVIDIRTAPEWQQTGVVPGSHLLTFFDDRGRADPAAWLEKARGIAQPNDAVVVICRSGNRTRSISQFLSEQVGYGKVYNVKHGIGAWIREGRPVVQTSLNIAGCNKANAC